MLTRKHKREPVDFIVPKEKLGIFFDNKSDEFFNIKIKEKNFSFQRTISRDFGIIYAFSCEPEDQEKALILKSIFEGNPITVNDENAEFLNKVSEILGISEFSELTKNYIDENSKKHSCFYSVVVFILNSILKLFINLGNFGKILFTFWDFMGSTYMTCFFANIAVLISTTAFHTVTADPVSFVFVLLPFLLYSLFFTNLITLSVFETFHFRFFTTNTSEKCLFFKFQTIFLLFLRVTPLGDKIMRKKAFSIGIYYDALWGFLFLLFGICFLGQLLFEEASFLVEIFIAVFAVGIPPIKHMLLYVFYLLHVFASCFESCRNRFKSIKDFEDPFLCALYFRKLRVVDLIMKIKERNKRIRPIDEDSIDSFSISEDFNFFDINYENEYLDEDNEEENTNNKSKNENKKKIRNDDENDSMCKTVTFALLSKTVCSFYIVIAVLVYIITKSQTLKVSQILSVIFIFFIIVVPNCSAIDLPWIWIRRWRTEKITHQQLKTEFLGLQRSKKYLKWLKNEICWSDRFNVLRWVSFITSFFFFVLIVASLFVAATGRPGDTKESFGSMPQTRSSSSSSSSKIGLENDDSNSSNLIKRRMTTDPICYTNIKDLTILQHISLAVLSYLPSSQKDEINDLMNEYFGGENWTNDMTFLDVPFPDDKYDAVMRHVYIKSRKLVVFSVRGTATRMDILADVEIFFSSFLYDIILPFIPMLDSYSGISKDYFGKIKIIPRYVFRQFSLVDSYVNVLVDYIKKVEIKSDEDVIVIGHSLGGCLAKIASTVTGYPCVAVSAAGIGSVDSYYKEYDMFLQSSLVDVRPAQDFVVMFDRNAKSSFDVPCDSGAMKCHAVRRTLCQVGVMCGLAEEHREFCQNFFTEKQYDHMIDIGKPYFF